MRMHLASIGLVVVALGAFMACNGAGQPASPASPSASSSSVDDLSFDTAGPLPDGVVRVLGSIRAIRGTCPELALAVRDGDGRDVQIRTSRETRFEGTPCGGLKADTRLGALGRRDGTNVLHALRVLSPLPR